MRLRTKIIFYCSAIMAATILFISMVALTLTRRQVVNRELDYWLNQSYDDQIFFMTYLQREYGEDIEEVYGNIAPFMAMYLSRNADGCVIQIYDSKGELLGSSSNVTEDIPMDDVISAVGGNKTYMIVKLGKYEHLLLSCPIFLDNSTIGCIRYVDSLEKEMTAIEDTSGIFLAAVVLAASAALLMNWLMADSIVRPIRELSKVSRKLSAGEFICTSPEGGNDEISELVENFNEMSRRLEQYVERLQDEKERQHIFFNNVTHDLKTPLTSIIGYSQMMDRIGIADEKIRQCNYYISHEGQRLYELIEEILNMSRYMNYDMEFTPEPVCVYELIEECLNTLRPRIHMNDIYTENLVSPSIILRIDRKYNKELFLNLLDNCIKYSQCSELTFTSRGSCEIIISDNGHGVSGEDLNLLMQPFYQPKTSSCPSGRGNGLGLSICKRIMEQQNGKMYIESEEFKYFRVILEYSFCDRVKEEKMDH